MRNFLVDIYIYLDIFYEVDIDDGSDFWTCSIEWFNESQNGQGYQAYERRFKLFGAKIFNEPIYYFSV